MEDRGQNQNQSGRIRQRAEQGRSQEPQADGLWVEPLWGPGWGLLQHSRSCVPCNLCWGWWEDRGHDISCKGNYFPSRSFYLVSICLLILVFEGPLSICSEQMFPRGSHTQLILNLLSHESNRYSGGMTGIKKKILQ